MNIEVNIKDYDFQTVEITCFDFCIVFRMDRMTYENFKKNGRLNDEILFKMLSILKDSVKLKIYDITENGND